MPRKFLFSGGVYVMIISNSSSRFRLKQQPLNDLDNFYILSKLEVESLKKISFHSFGSKLNIFFQGYQVNDTRHTIKLFELYLHRRHMITRMA